MTTQKSRTDEESNHNIGLVEYAVQPRNEMRFNRYLFSFESIIEMCFDELERP